MIDIVSHLSPSRTDDDTDTLWQALTSKEREQFHKMLQSGALGRLVDTHTPWWEVWSTCSLCHTHLVV